MRPNGEVVLWRRIEWSFEDGEEESANRQWVWDAKVDVAAASSGAFTAASGAIGMAGDDDDDDGDGDDDDNDDYDDGDDKR